MESKSRERVEGRGKETKTKKETDKRDGVSIKKEQLVGREGEGDGETEGTGKSANERQRKRKRERERAKGRERVVDGKRVHDWVEELVLPSRLPCLGSRFVLLRPSKVGGNLRVLSVKT